MIFLPDLSDGETSDNMANVDKGEGVKKFEKIADVINGCSLMART